MFPQLHIHVLHAVMFFRALGVVEPVQSAYEVAGDPADTLESDALPYSLFHALATPSARREVPAMPRPWGILPGQEGLAGPADRP